MLTSVQTPFPTPPNPEQNALLTDSPEELFKEQGHRLGLVTPVEEPNLKDLTLLSTGGTGEIYTARDEVLGRTIAVKTLRNEFEYNDDQMERIVREAKAAAQLEHPNIVPIHSLGISPSKGIYFTMKRLRGDALRYIITQLAERTPGYVREYTNSARLNIFIKICQGISYAHNKGVIHRDLKPENILVGNFGEVTIIDWGLVKNIDTSGQKPRQLDCKPSQAVPEHAPISTRTNVIDLPPHNPTLTGELNGTPRFMSPEQIIGNNDEIDARTDIYALGVILYELLTFTNPFNQYSTEEDILNAVSRGLYDRPRHTYYGADIAPELEAICLKAMHVNRENRYQSVSELIKDIMAHQEGKPVSAYNAPLSVRLHKCCRRNPIKTAILLSSICAICVFMFSTHLLSHISVSEILDNAAHDVNFAIQKLKTLDNTISRGQDSGTPVPPELFLAALNEIDNIAISVNTQLRSLPQTQQDAHAARRLRERLTSERVRFALNHGDLNDLKKVRGAIQAQFGYDYSPHFSTSFIQLIHRLDSALEGLCTLSVTSPDEKATFTIASLQENNEGLLTIGQPVQLSQNTLPAPDLIIPKGDYVITFTSPGKPDCQLFFSLQHGEQATISVNPPTQILPGTVFIPEPKTSIRQTDPQRSLPPSDLTTPKPRPFFIAIHEVSLEEYRQFWLSLDDTALRDKYLPRIRLEENDPRCLSPWNDSGEYNDATLNGFPMFTPECPVTGIPREAATAFCSWKGRQLLRVCRLPSAAEWLRAATGDNHRKYPWGNNFHNEYAFLKDNLQARVSHALFAPVGSFPNDRSPYGLFDVAGNAREWTSTPFPDDNDCQIKGASASTTHRYLPLDSSSTLSAFPSDIGFRYLIEYQDDLDALPVAPDEPLPVEPPPPDNF